jgi:transketolase
MRTTSETEIYAARARKLIIETLIHAMCGHPGGALSSVEILIALFFQVLKINPDSPNWPERDRFILSKGHSSIGLYSVMHLRGFFDKETLMTFRQDDSLLSGHPDMHKLPGVEMSTGSLGHGLSVGVGMALAAKKDKKEYKTYVLLGDGESQEGSVWEAAMSAGHFKLDNLIGIVDRNRFQIDGNTENTMKLEPFREKWEAFGWAVNEVNGHDLDELVECLKKIPFKRNRPSLIIANTIKGKGVSFMENTHAWHGGAPTGQLAVKALEEVTDNLERIECQKPQ